MGNEYDFGFQIDVFNLMKLASLVLCQEKCDVRMENSTSILRYYIIS